MAAVNPYLNFGGNAEQAFEFYRSVFGTEYTDVMRFRDMPAETIRHAPCDMDKIMHIALPIGGNSVLMGSDKIGATAKEMTGDNYHLSVNADNEAEAKRLFYGLADGGYITMPLKTGLLNSLFGMLTDKFGVQWMVIHHPVNDKTSS